MRITNTWKSNKLLKGLTESEFTLLNQYLIPKEFNPDEFIIKEGDKGDFIYFLEDGKVEVLRQGVAINTLNAGESFGAMSLLDNSKRSASIKSVGLIAVKALSFETLNSFSIDAENSKIFKKILLNHVKQQQTLVKKGNDGLINEMKEKLKAAELRVNFSSMFINVTLGLVGYIFILDVFARLKIQGGLIFNTLLIVFLGVGAYVYIKKSTFPPELFGLSLKNWKPAVKEAITWSFGFIAIAVALKWLVITTIPSLQEIPLLTMNVFYSFGWLKSTLFVLVYSLTVPLQEIVVRCAFQGSLQHFIDGKYATTKAILIASCVFSAFHLVGNPFFAYASFIPSIFWGILFARNPSLLAVSISHTILGIFFIYFEYLPIPGLVQL